MKILFDIIKYAISTIGIGVVSEKLFRRPTPSPPNLLSSIASNPATPFVSALLFQRPELVTRPLSRTSGGLTAVATKTAQALWSEKQLEQQQSSVSQAATFFWLAIDKTVDLAIKKPKIVGFVFISGCVMFVIMEPIIHDYLESRRLKKLERKIKRRYQEEALIKSVTDALLKDSSGMVSNLITNLKETSDGELSDLGKQDYHSQREIILKAIRNYKK